MSIEEKLITVAENQEKVYNAGYEKGKAEGGDNYYDTFWDVFQNIEGGGIPFSYYQAFAYNHFNDETYNPKYNIICSTETQSAWFMFQNATKITSTKVPIDVTRTKELRYTFGCFNPPERSTLETIVELRVNENNTFANTFNLAYALKNIAITGTIGNNINFQWSPLSKESILSVFNALSTAATGQTVTFKKTAVEAAFTTDEWNALIATKTNWSYGLS